MLNLNCSLPDRMTRIGIYEIRAELGRGGMGRVYRAYDPRLDHEVAIKVLSSDGDAELLDRFRTEAGTTAKLHHKNIVTVHTYGEQDGMPYLVMELLKGEDLAHVIRDRKPLSVLEKVRIMHEVAQGLSHAHENGVIHRDVKPANMMLLADGGVKIMDFGIARFTRGTSLRRTQQGIQLGTLTYMAPEQLQAGMDADELVDIFAFGVVFYLLITGVHPFQAEDTGTVIYRITTTEPKPIREAAPDCPESLADIIHTLLAKDRRLRYQSLRDAILDIEPTLFELRQQRARQILTEVEGVIRAGQLDAALTMVKEALELDPLSQRGRQLRARLQQELNRSAIDVRVRSLLQEGDSLVAQQRLQEAIRIFENTVRLDNTGRAQAKLDAARRELDHLQRATTATGLQAPAAASATATGGIESSRVRPAGKPVDGSNDQLERERRVKDAVQTAARYCVAGDHERGLQTLETAIQQLGQVDALTGARERVLQIQADAGRRTRELTHAEDIAGRKRTADINAVVEEVKKLAKASRFDEAKQMVSQALTRYPGDRELESTLGKVAALERAQLLARAVEHIKGLLTQGRLQEALKAADVAIKRYPEHAPFRELAAQIDARVSAARPRVESVTTAANHAGGRGVQEVVERCRMLAAAGSNEDALAEIERGLVSFPGSDELKDIAKDLRAELYRIRRDEKLRVAIQAIEASIAASDWPRAKTLIKAAFEDFPTEPRIQELREALRRANEQDR